MFVRALADATRVHVDASRPRRFVAVAYDQLNDAIGPLARLDPRDAGIVLVENAGKAKRRPYHQQKLFVLLANQRHFALEQARRGVFVDYRFSDDDEAGDGYARAFAAAAKQHGPLVMMEPAERELRVALRPLVAEGTLELTPHQGFLTTTEDFAAAGPADGPYRMDAFYRAVRRRLGILMDERGKPVGGRFSFDGDNREPYRGDPPAPTPPRFAVDEVTAEVAALVRARFGHHPGVLDEAALPVTKDDVEAFWRWALQACLPHFGPHEDAMTEASRGLFHTRAAPLLNLHRLLPSRVVEDALKASLPLSSQEGFVRQVLGWREFVRHVHNATDGFRVVNGKPIDVDATGHAAPRALLATAPLPRAYWDKSAPVGSPWRGSPSGLRCLDQVVDAVWAEGYSHHITRLMVLGNIATLLGVDPRALTDWFWVAYTDAYDWVVEPNVLGMATFGAGDVMTTKPYVAGSAYIDRMSDFCGGCAFDPKKTCPLPAMYWDTLGRNAAALEDNERMKLPMGSWRRRTAAQRSGDETLTQIVRRVLCDEGRALTPADLGAPAKAVKAVKPKAPKPESKPKPKAQQPSLLAGTTGTTRSSAPRASKR